MRMRSYAFGDLSSNFRGRSGDEEIGALLEHPEFGSITIRLFNDGTYRVTASQPHVQLAPVIAAGNLKEILPCD